MRGKPISRHIDLRSLFLDTGPHAGRWSTGYGKGRLAHQPASRTRETIVFLYQAVPRFQVDHVALPVQSSDREPKTFGTSEPTSVQKPQASPVCGFLLSVRLRTPPPPLRPPRARHPNLTTS